jgi:exoribonuclease II
MPKPSNDALVQRHRELRATLINKHSKLTVERVAKLIDSRKAKKPTVEEIAEVIATEFQASPV